MRGDHVKSFVNELQIMRKFDHLNVLNLIGVCLDYDGFPLIVFPLMPNKDLKTYIRNNQVFKYYIYLCIYFYYTVYRRFIATLFSFSDA